MRDDRCDHGRTAALSSELESDPLPLDVLRKRRRWPRIVSVVALVVTVVVTVATTVFQFGLPWWMDEGDRNHVYRSEAGSLRYQVHLPPHHDGSTQLPVIVAKRRMHQ